MSPLRKALVTTAAFSLVSIGGVATAGSAQADPGSCTLTTGRTAAHVKCTSGSGTYRVWAKCYDEIHSSFSTVTGPWVHVGATSSVSCPQNFYIPSGYTSGIDIKLLTHAVGWAGQRRHACSRPVGHSGRR